MTIPVSTVVSINPGVISAGGNALDLNALMITENPAIPIGAVQAFATATDVSDFFGPSAPETALATQYFLGFANSTQKPGNLLFAQFNAAAVAGYLRGADLGAMTLTELQAFSGVISITVGGVVETSAAINLATATSFSDAATLIQAGFTTPPFTVSYDSIRNAFVFTTTATGTAATIGYASGTLAPDLLLEQSNGAVLSQGAAAQTPAGLMASILNVTLNWGTFMTTYNDTTANKVAYADWANGQNNRFAYILWSTDGAALVTPDTTSALAQIIAAGYSGTCGIYCDPIADPTGIAPAFVCGAAASIDFSATNGRITFDFKYQSGVPVSVTDASVAANLKSNGYNYVGAYATANQGFTWFGPGSVTDEYLWLDAFLNQVYLNAQLQLALITLLTTVNSVPYDPSGRTMIQAACLDPIAQAVNFGSINVGVALSALQAAEVNNAAGVAIDKTLTTQGWYLQVLPGTAQVRGARQSPPISLWYMDGGAVQQINVASILIQ